MSEKKNIAILGSTGSIGTQTLAVVKQHPSLFNVEVLTANHNATLLVQQAEEFQPQQVVIIDPSQYSYVKNALTPKGIVVSCGAQALCEVVTLPSVSIVLTAMVGFSGLAPTIAAIKAGKTIALANKETLVVAGNLISQLAQQHQSTIIPVDSEHSAIFQCLVGEQPTAVEKIILTASGGPFRGKNTQWLQNITKTAALQHPNWNMGAKITIDSASLMNKGLEVIEAKWLFNLNIEQIEVIVHPQSIIHSMVQFCDGSIKAQMGLPDMKLPIQYALSYPQRLANHFPRFNFTDYSNLSFEQADRQTFRNLDLAYQALELGGNMPCILNAANEIAVAKFLEDKISFLAMSDLVTHCMQKITHITQPCLEDYLQTDTETRAMASEYMQ